MHTSLVKTAEKQQSQSLFANVISVSQPSKFWQQKCIKRFNTDIGCDSSLRTLALLLAVDIYRVYLKSESLALIWKSRNTCETVRVSYQVFSQNCPFLQEIFFPMHSQNMRLLLFFPPFTLFSAFPPFTLFSAFYPFFRFSAFYPFFRFSAFYPFFRFSAFYPFFRFSAFYPFFRFSAFPPFTLFSVFPFPLFRFRFSVSAFYPYPVLYWHFWKLYVGGPEGACLIPHNIS